MNAETVILIRTAGFDERLGEVARRIEQKTTYPVCLVVDETRGTVVVPATVRKISVNDGAIAALRLLAPDGFSWRCGDYPFYLARQCFPDARWFWQLEPDVKINFADEAEFFRRYTVYPEIDLIAPYLREAEPHWGWRSTMEPFASVVYRCFFPLVRLSARAVDHLLLRRQALTAFFEQGQATHAWPNDEAFVATELRSAPLVCADLNFNGLVCSPSQFEYYRAFSEAYFVEYDNRVYHSVLHGPAFVARLRLCLDAAVASWASVPERQAITAMLRRHSLFDEIAQEAGALEAQSLLTELTRLTDLPSATPCG